MDVIDLITTQINWENVISLVQLLIGLRLIGYLIGTLILIAEERDSHSAIGRLRAARTGKIFRMNWNIVLGIIFRWTVLFILSIFYKEIIVFLGAFLWI